MATTFMWTSSDGKVFDVEPDYDIDNWSGREVRSVERLGGGSMPSGQFSTMGVIFAVAIARTVPGYTIDSADAELTFGRIRAIYDEIKAKEVAERERLAAEALPAGDDQAEEDVVLSPTRPGEPGDTPEPDTN